MTDTAKKCILFVDDEPHLLNALRRMLRSQRGQWEMLFAPSGAHAMTQVIGRKVDVIVSDMRMPHMDGTELLRMVSQASPDTIRIVLSGQATDQPKVDLVHYAHQYLSKPCESEILISTIERASILHDLLVAPKLQRLVTGLDSLPSMPELYQRMRRELSSDNASLQRIGEIIAQDPAMSGKILQIVNSAFFAQARQLTDPAEAVMRLGLEIISKLVLTAGVFNQIDQDLYEEFQLERLWLHDIRTSAIARNIAIREQQPRSQQETAATVGLLHDAGLLVLAGKRPDLYRGVLTLAQHEGMPLAEAERLVLGTTHAEIGAYLLGLWGLPNEVILAIAHHLDCDTSSKETPPLACMVRMAEILEQQLSTSATPAPAMEIDREFLASQGFDERLPVWRKCAEEVMRGVS